MHRVSVRYRAMSDRIVIRLARSSCYAAYDTRQLVNLCRACGGPILVHYGLSPTPELRNEIRTRPADMWRYAEVLPVREGDDIVTLGEGITPLLRSRTDTRLWIKDESKNP